MLSPAHRQKSLSGERRSGLAEAPTAYPVYRLTMARIHYDKRDLRPSGPEQFGSRA
jgi:hypothetical protein